MQRKFLSNLVFLIFLNLLVKPFWVFGIDRAVQNEVGAEAYGSYFALFNFALILNIILDLGISNYNNRNISQHQHLLGKYFPRIVLLRLILAVAYLVICLFAALLLDYSASQLSMLTVLCFNQFLLSFILFLRSNISGLHLFRIDSAISVLDRLLMIASCGWILWSNKVSQPFQIEWFVYLQTASYLITACIAFVVILKFGNGFRLHWNAAILRVILKQSLPFALLILLMSVYGRIDSVLIERLLSDGKTQAGIYAQAFRLLDASNMIAYLFAVLLLPMFSRMLKMKENVAPLVRVSLKLLLIPAFTLGVISYFQGEELMNLLYHEHANASAKSLAILMFSLIPMAGVYVVGTLLTSNGNLKLLNIIAFGTVIISLTLNLTFIPTYGAKGAAITCLLTQSIGFLLQLAASVRTFDLKLASTFLTVLICSGLVVAVGFFLRHQSWQMAALVTASVGGLTTITTTFQELKSFKTLGTEGRN